MDNYKCALHLFQRSNEYFARFPSDPSLENLSKWNEGLVFDFLKMDGETHDVSSCHPFIATKRVLVSPGSNPDNIEDAVFSVVEDGYLQLNVGCSDIEFCPKVNWTIVDAMETITVHVNAVTTNLTSIKDQSVSMLYSSHTLEHLSAVSESDLYEGSELCATMTEWNRVLRPSGELFISVPDFEILSEIFTRKTLTRLQKNSILSIIFGGQVCFL